MRYLWWAEFQKRGAIHYHMVIVDPPFELLRDARHWFDAHWTDAAGRPLAGIQTWVDWKSGAWFRRRAGDYVLKDVRKLHGKRYEQDYERMPRGWRTFRSHQLAFTAAEHQEHESKAWTTCTARADAPWHERQAEIWIYRIDRHVPARDGCRLTRRRPTRRGIPECRRDDVSATLQLPGSTAPHSSPSHQGLGPPVAALRPAPQPLQSELPVDAGVSRTQPVA